MAMFQVRDGATLLLSKVGVSQQPEDSQQDLPGERESLPPTRTLLALAVSVDQRPPCVAISGELPSLRGSLSAPSLQATPSWRRRTGCGTWCGPRTRWTKASRSAAV